MAKNNRILNRIKPVLAERNKSSIWLSQQMNLHESSVSKWCTNDSQPSLKKLFAIADALGVDVRELLVPNEQSPRKKRYADE